MAKRVKTSLENPENSFDINRQFKARGARQEEAIKNIIRYPINFLSGPAGCGKTAIAIYMAIRALQDNKVNKIILTRPIKICGSEQGFLPGSSEDKIFPHIFPLMDELYSFVGKAEVAKWKSTDKLEISPLGYMRGRNFHNCFIVADEMSNSTLQETKMLLTRIGRNSTMVLTGDPAQSDLKPYEECFQQCMDRLTGLNFVGTVIFQNEDIVRNKIIGEILERLKGL